MKPTPHQPMLARAAGMPIFGKRTESLKTSVSTLTKEQAKKVAEASGFANVGDWVHAVIVHEVHRKSNAIVGPKAFDVYRNNPANSGAKQ